MNEGNKFDMASAEASDVPPTCTVRVTGGTFARGINKITSITVDGVEILGASIDWTASNSKTASLLAARINTNACTPHFTAVAAGDTVTISAAGAGATLNGRQVAVIVGGNVVISLTAMFGGVGAGWPRAKQKRDRGNPVTNMASAAAKLRAQYLPAMKRAGVAGLLDVMRNEPGLRVQAAACLDEHRDAVREVRPAEAPRILAEVALIVGPYMLARLAARAAR